MRIKRALRGDSKVMRCFFETNPGWRLSHNQQSIASSYIFKDFETAIAFINRVACSAQKRNHHPDIVLTKYRCVKLRLKTQCAGGVTVHDLRLAAQMDRIGQILGCLQKN